MNTIKVGDKVMWRGSWGQDEPKEAIITQIDICEKSNQKEGIQTNIIDEIDKHRSLFTLENGHWAYGYQIDSIKTN